MKLPDVGNVREADVFWISGMSSGASALSKVMLCVMSSTVQVTSPPGLTSTVAGTKAKACAVTSAVAGATSTVTVAATVWVKPSAVSDAVICVVPLPPR